MKFTGRYTAATAKALKGSPRLVCQVTEDGTIYVCNGFLLCTMNPPEYAATVQGFTCCEPGNWTLDKDGKHEDDAHKLDLVRLYADTLKTNADAQPLQRSPLTVQHETKPEQPAAETVEPKTAAEIIAARWAEVDGLTATIKGAATAAPVVWLSGDTKPHAKAIEADGGKWSGKKNAYYFRVA